MIKFLALVVLMIFGTVLFSSIVILEEPPAFIGYAFGIVVGLGWGIVVLVHWLRQESLDEQADDRGDDRVVR